MPRITYPSSSPYATTKQSANFIGLYKHRPIKPHRDDREYTITQKYHLRPDLLAFDLYGKEDYWWVFYVRNLNVIRDPIWDFTVGATIWYPSPEHLRSIA